MRNKWFVAGASLGAAVFAAAAIRAAFGDLPLLALVPGALSLGLVVVAVRTARADSFGPVPKREHDPVRPPAVLRWLKHREDDAAAHPSKPATTPAVPKWRP